MKPRTVITVALAGAISLAISACFHDKGLKVGHSFKDCTGIASNQREDAARAIKGMSRADAIKKLAAMYSITEAAAGECLK